MRLIDVDVFEVVFFEGKSEEFVEGATYVLEQIDKQPTVEAKPIVRGGWLYHEDYFFTPNECSECGTLEEFKTKFCPNCGADMRSNRRVERKEK